MRANIERLHAENPQGSVVIQADPAAHDKAMAVIQALRHFATFSFGKFLFERQIALDQTLEISIEPAAAAPAGAFAETVIKVATVTPEGSTWTKVLHEMTAEIEAKTEGAVTFQVYAGGISGDEPDVIRKMRINQIQAAMVTDRASQPPATDDPRAVVQRD